MIMNHFKLVGQDGSFYNATESRLLNRVCGLEDSEFFVGLPEYRLGDGRALNKGEDGRFMIVQTGEVLTIQPGEIPRIETSPESSRNLCKRPWDR